MIKARDIAMRLRWEIKEEKRYIPGTRLPSHRELAARFATTRTTIARAMQILIDEGLIRTVPGRGTLVTGMPYAGLGVGAHLERHLRRLAADGHRIERADAIAEDWSTSLATVRRVLRRLVVAGVITRNRNGTYAGRPSERTA